MQLLLTRASTQFTMPIVVNKLYPSLRYVSKILENWVIAKWKNSYKRGYTFVKEPKHVADGGVAISK